MTFETWFAFFVACWLISLSPGPGAVACMTTGMRYGYRKGLINIAGLITGVLALLVLVATGLGALLAASQAAFVALKWFGVVYLIYLGIQQWRAPAKPIEAADVGAGAARDLFWRGFLVNASNPKAIVFFLAVLPQFIDPTQPLLPQYLICAPTLAFTDFVLMSAYTAVAAKVLKGLRNPSHIRWMNRSFGGMFVGAGVLLAGFKRAA